GSTVSIEPNTELTIEKASALSDGSTLVLMQQNFGRTWHVVTKLITGNSKYEVKTPASTATVRGTAFQVDSDSERTIVTTTEGTVVDRVADRGREPVKAQGRVTADKDGQGRASVDLTRAADGKTDVKQSNGSPSSTTPSAVDALLGGKKP